MIVADAAEVAATAQILAVVIVSAHTPFLCDALTLSFDKFFFLTMFALCFLIITL